MTLDQKCISRREEIAAQSFRAYGGAKLEALCNATGFSEEKATALRLFDLLLDGWGEQPLGRVPAWRSDITNGHAPYEFSIAFEGDRRELRFLVEVQGRPMSLRSGWEAGLAACERLHQALGVPLDRLRCVEDLFAPKNPEARFALWHAVCLRRIEQPDIKIYLNPYAQGPEAAPALMAEALQRLGFSNTWRYLSEVVFQRGDRLAYFSLDLSAHSSARVKIYLVQPALTAEGVERVMATDPGYTPGGAGAFYRTIRGGEGPSESRPGGICLAFTSEDDARPSSTTLYLPVWAYVENDQQTAQRIRQCLEPNHRNVFEAGLSAVAERPLEAGVGLMQWVSMKRRNGQNRVTVYMAPEAYEVMPSL